MTSRDKAMVVSLDEMTKGSTREAILAAAPTLLVLVLLRLLFLAEEAVAWAAFLAAESEAEVEAGAEAGGGQRAERLRLHVHVLEVLRENAPQEQ